MMGKILLSCPFAVPGERDKARGAALTTSYRLAALGGQGGRMATVSAGVPVRSTAPITPSPR
jgi:hypothetical protein